MSPDDATLEESEELISIACNVTVIEDPAVKLSSFTLYKRVTAYIHRFIHNCKAKIWALQSNDGPLTAEELNQAANYYTGIPLFRRHGSQENWRFYP